MVKAANAAQIASGEVVFALNEAAGKTVFYQNLKTGEITLTAAEDGSNLVIKNADGTYSNPVKEPEVTEPEDPNPPTRDTGFTLVVVASAVALVACACIVMIGFKKKEN